MTERNNDMARNLIVAAVVALLMAGFVLAYALLVPGARARMGGMGMAEGGATVPPVKGYAEGEEILFLHAEASNQEIADMLTEMMGSTVLVVPSLANAPPAMLSDVYVFSNGVTGDGPFGFQPDVFDEPPPSEGYTPLRTVNKVAWRDPGAARELRSANEVREAANAGELTVQPTGAVVNMPLVTWPGGGR